MRPAVFLDRDGVLNHAIVRAGKPYPPQTLQEFELLPGVEAACVRLQAHGFSLVVVTNQPDVGRGTQSREIVETMHARLREALPLDRIEVCYDPGGPGAPPSPDRKPRPGMILRAAAELGIDLRASYVIGDRWRDIDCGHAAGCRTIFIDLGYDEPLRAPPDFRARDLPEAVEIILGNAAAAVVNSASESLPT